MAVQVHNGTLVWNKKTQDPLGDMSIAYGSPQFSTSHNLETPHDQQFLLHNPLLTSNEADFGSLSNYSPLTFPFQKSIVMPWSTLKYACSTVWVKNRRTGEPAWDLATEQSMGNLRPVNFMFCISENITKCLHRGILKNNVFYRSLVYCGDTKVN